jgi:hypothetical protein
MSEICNNLLAFFSEHAACLDKNKEKLKQTDVNFHLALANCGDKFDEIVQQQEDHLDKRVNGMKRAPNHVVLNEKL